MTALQAQGELVVADEEHGSPAIDMPEAVDALEPVEKTLLIPLLARVWGHRLKLDLAQPDYSAERVLHRLRDQVPAWIPDPVTLCCILWRTRQMMILAQIHFDRHPRSWGVNLGAGLSDYFQWLDSGVNHWLDTDLKSVMQLRLHCMPQHARAMGLPLDVCEENWWQCVAACIKDRREPIFFMLEGVLLYLQPNQACQVLAILAEFAPEGSCVAFDVIPTWLVGWPVGMPWVGADSPVFRWGVQSIQALEAIHPRLHLQSVMSSPLATTGWSWLAPTLLQPFTPCTVVRMLVS